MPTRAVWLVALLSTVMLAAPVVLSGFPPLVDYPSHLARLHILTHPEDAFLAAHYRPDWQLLPNLGFDLIGIALAQMMPVEIAGRVFLVLVVAVTVTAPLALHWALYGRLAVLPLLAGPLVFNRALQMGFLSYCLGVGMAIWGFAVWYALRDRAGALRFAVLQAIALVLFVCHLYALAIFAVLVTFAAAASGWRQGVGPIRAVAPVALAFVLPAILMLTGPAGGGEVATAYRGLWQKLAMLPLALLADLAPSNLVLALVALSPVVLARLGGGCAVHPAVVWPLAALFLLYWALPDRLMSSQNADWRLLVPLALVLAGGAEDPFRGRGAWVLAGVALAVNLGAAATAQAVWRAGDALGRDLASVLSALPEDQVLSPYPSPQTIEAAFLPPSAFHMAAYAVIRRGAFVPSVFAHAGQQPLALADPDGAGAGWQDWLAQGARGQSARDLLARTGGYVLAIRGPGEGPGVPIPPVAAEPVAEAGRFTLYRLAATGG